MTQQHRKVFGTDEARKQGERNYCALAVRARLARLQVIGWDGPDADEAQRVWEASRLHKTQDRMARWSLAYGVSWLVADVVERTLTPNKPSLVAALEDVDDPDQWRVAGKHWEALREDGKTEERCALWYADRSEMWSRVASKEWEQYDEEPQPAGRVPVAKVDPYGDGPVLMDLLAHSQGRVNRIGANKMVAGDFAAFAQWVFLTRQQFLPGDLESSPGEALVLDPGEEDWKAGIHQMQYTPLSNYDASKDSEIDDLMTLAALPRHMRVNPGSPPSGDAVKADEGSLIEETEDHQRELGESYSDGMALLDIDAEPIWKDPTPHDDLTQAQEFSLLAPQVGWRMAAKVALNWTPEQIAEAERMNVTIAGNPTGADLLAGAEDA